MRPQPLAFHRSTGRPSAPAVRVAVRVRKPFTRRRGDASQQVRFGIQASFAAIALWVGAQFVLWVRYVESGGTTVRAARPDGVDAWLPIASLMNLKLFVLTRTVPGFHAAGMFMLIAFLAISFLCRKAFCSWICPIGTLSEWLWQTGRLAFGRSFAPPRWLDVSLRGLKYILLALFLYVVAAMSVPEIQAFLGGPYGLVADVKMLNFFRHMGEATAVVLAVLAALSLVVRNPWCRYLCPYGALMGLAAIASPSRIVRNADACIDCAKCAKACPAALPVDVLASVRSAECTACLSCVAACPAAGAIDLRVGLRRQTVLPAWALAAMILIVFLGVVGYARVAGHWHTPVPDRVYSDLVPRADEFAHPR